MDAHLLVEVHQSKSDYDPKPIPLLPLFPRCRNDCAVVVANQMSDMIGPDEHEKMSVPTQVAQQRTDGFDTRQNIGQSSTESRRKGGQYAAMGLAWAQAINTRIVLQRCGHHPAYYDSSGRGGQDEDGDATHLGLRQVCGSFYYHSNHSAAA